MGTPTELKTADSPNPVDSQTVAAYARSVPGFARAALPNEYYYNSLSLCVIDAVFSIGVRYDGVRRVVERYCTRFHVTPLRAVRGLVPPIEHQESLRDLCERFEQLGVQAMATDVFANRQRTSARGGILKAEAVWRFAQALR